MRFIERNNVDSYSYFIKHLHHKAIQSLHMSKKEKESAFYFNTMYGL